MEAVIACAPATLGLRLLPHELVRTPLAPPTIAEFVIGCQRAGVARHQRSDQAELDDLAAARVSRAMRMAVIAAACAPLSFSVVANAPLRRMVSASASAWES